MIIKETHTDWVVLQFVLARRLQSTDMWAPVAPFRDTGYHTVNIKSNTEPCILAGVKLLIDHHAGGIRTGSEFSRG